jgi:hypothetical protein
VKISETKIPLYYRFVRRRFVIVTDDDEVFVKIFMRRLTIGSAIAFVLGLLLCSLPDPFNAFGQAIFFISSVCLSASVVTHDRFWKNNALQTSTGSPRTDGFGKTKHGPIQHNV